jgi:hypothetical protein
VSAQQGIYPVSLRRAVRRDKKYSNFGQILLTSGDSLSTIKFVIGNVFGHHIQQTGGEQSPLQYDVRFKTAEVRFEIVGYGLK